MYIYAASVGRHPWRSTKVTAIPKTSDCDEFNWLGDTNDTLLNSSLLLLVWSLTGPRLRVAAGVASCIVYGCFGMIKPQRPQRAQSQRRERLIIHRT